MNLRPFIKQYRRRSICFALLNLPCFFASAGATVLLTGPCSQDTTRQLKQVVCLNQSGYNTGWPKRFTAPLAPEGAVFQITGKGKGNILYSGRIVKGTGDFSSFNPVDTAQQYIIKVSGGNLQEGVSYPFNIGRFWLENTLTQSALDFMVDSRSITGTHPSAYGGTPWRDGTFYSYEVPSLVLQYLSNPAFYENAPVQINYKKDRAMVLDSNFKYYMEAEGQTALQTVRKYYRAIDAPVGPHVPDIIQLIHWGIGYYLIDPVTRDPSGGDEGRKLHPQTLEQFAYFLYGYPYFKEYFTAQFYQQAKQLVTKEWAYTGLFGVFTAIGSGKGREAPGHSVMPNLFMYEVAMRDGDKDAERYFRAAYLQTEWIIQNLDLNDPRTTKGQRMNEHQLITALVYFLKQYPDKAPPKLKEKITKWIDIAIARSDNMWDFRRYDLGKNWTIPGYSETGNITGFPAIAVAAASVTQNAQQKERLLQLATAAIDDLFGRNPQNACSPSQKDLGFTNLEKGWPKEYTRDVCARLETVRGTFSSISTTDMYPYNPAGKFGHLEGWVVFNAGWNVSLAYLNNYDTRLSVMDKHYKSAVETVPGNSDIYVQLEAPAVTSGQIKLNYTDANGLEKALILKQVPSYGHIYRGVFKTALLVGASAPVTLSYGGGLFKKTILLIRNKDRVTITQIR